MTRRVLLPLLLIAAFVVLSTSQPAAAAWSNCGTYPRFGKNIKAYNTSCQNARHVAKHYWVSLSHGGDPGNAGPGWTCRYVGNTSIAHKSPKYRCKKDRHDVLRLVTFRGYRHF